MKKMKKMKERMRKIGLILVGSLLSFMGVQSRAMTITVFTNKQHPVIGTTKAEIHYYDTDASNGWLFNDLNRSIAGLDSTMALKKAHQLLKQHQASFKEMGQGMQAMHRYKIHQIPTIVFDDGCYQIAGQTDLQVAIKEYKTWRKTHE